MRWHEAIREEYRLHRYMKDLNDDAFTERFNNVFKNLLTISDDGKISVPLVGSSNSIYWMTMWTHVLEEAELRGGALYGFDSEYVGNLNPFLEKVDKERIKIIRGKVKDKKYLYKYGKREYLSNFIERGEILIRPASYYSDPSLNKAISDYELYREYYIKDCIKDKIKLLLKKPKKEKCLFIKNVYRKIMKTDYYVFCLSTEFDPRLFMDFDADACLLIKNQNSFLNNINVEYFRKSKFTYDNDKINYIDPILSDPLEGSIPYTKYYGYTYQKEYRCTFIPKQNVDKLNEKYISVRIDKDEYEMVSIIE